MWMKRRMEAMSRRNLVRLAGTMFFCVCAAMFFTSCQSKEAQSPVEVEPVRVTRLRAGSTIAIPQPIEGGTEATVSITLSQISSLVGERAWNIIAVDPALARSEDVETVMSRHNGQVIKLEFTVDNESDEYVLFQPEFRLEDTSADGTNTILPDSITETSKAYPEREVRAFSRVIIPPRTYEGYYRIKPEETATMVFHFTPIAGSTLSMLLRMERPSERKIGIVTLGQEL